jgi:hypothetical protein
VSNEGADMAEGKLHLLPPEPSTDALRALAASGSTRFARKAKAALQARVIAELRKAVGHG